MLIACVTFKLVFIAWVAFKLPFLACVASSLRFLAWVAFELVLGACRFSVSSHGIYRLQVCFHGICHQSHLQVVVHGVGRLPSLVS